MSHLEIEIEKSKRYGYPFSLVVVQTLNQDQLSSVLLKSIIEANYRSVDVVAKSKPHQYMMLLNHTKKEGAAKLISRIINVAVRERNIPVMSAVVEYEDGDTREKILARLFKKFQ